MKQQWLRWMGSAFLLSGLTGCAGFWEEVMSRERDWAYVTGRGMPDPLVVLENSNDGLRRSQALIRLDEPLQNGGDARKQETYLNVLAVAAKDDYEPLCRLTAIRTLGKYNDPRAARILEEVYQKQKLPFTVENNCLIRKEALVALVNTNDPESRHLLIRVARQPGPPSEASLTDRMQTQDEKIVAIRALAKFRVQESADALKYVLQTEKDPALRDRALASLETLTGKSWPTSYDAWQNQELQPQPSLANENNNFIQRVSGWVNKK
jgi:hypothetical protein